MPRKREESWDAYDARHEASLEVCTDRDAADEIARVLRGYSQDVFSASWMSEIEHIAWSSIMKGQALRYDHDTYATAVELFELYLTARGWWHWQTMPGVYGKGPTFVSSTEWATEHAKWLLRGPP